MEERFLGQILNDSVQKLVSEKIEQEIAKKVDAFKRELEDNKDRYIAEVMKGIRILHEREYGSMQMNYKIIFENIVKLEKDD